jgi:hypothetical protein
VNVTRVRLSLSLDRSEGPVRESSYFLGDPPPDPRFLASLGALSLVELGHCSVNRAERATGCFAGVVPTR